MSYKECSGYFKEWVYISKRIDDQNAALLAAMD